jgi:hypothetical protein
MKTITRENAMSLLKNNFTALHCGDKRFIYSQKLQTARVCPQVNKFRACFIPATGIFFQTAKQNTASRELALSLRFKFLGASLYVPDEGV